MSSKKIPSISDIQRYLQSRVSHCGLCGSQDWELEPDLHTLRFGNPWKSGKGKQIRCVLLTCSSCGNLHVIHVDRLVDQGKLKIEALSSEDEGNGNRKEVQIRKTDKDGPSVGQAVSVND